MEVYIRIMLKYSAIFNLWFMQQVLLRTGFLCAKITPPYLQRTDLQLLRKILFLSCESVCLLGTCALRGVLCRMPS